jgi:isopentenyl diphosphate isomerase/L-lactate dehydrogenase-like FMN-dependent dehydrogenase
VVFEGAKWEEKISFPIAMAPVSVLRIFNLDDETAATMAAAKEKAYFGLAAE